MEFKTKEELKKYLKEHPNADKSNHSVKKENSGTGIKNKLLDTDVFKKSLESDNIDVDSSERDFVRNVRLKWEEKNDKDLNKSFIKDFDMNSQKDSELLRIPVKVMKEVLDGKKKFYDEQRHFFSDAVKDMAKNYHQDYHKQEYKG